MTPSFTVFNYSRLQTNKIKNLKKSDNESNQKKCDRSGCYAIKRCDTCHQ